MFAQTITYQITMPWNRPFCSYQLEICREYAQICFRSQKISGSQLKPFGRYLKNPRGGKNTPLLLIGLIHISVHCPIQCTVGGVLLEGI